MPKASKPPTGPQVQKKMELYRGPQKPPRPQVISKPKQTKSPRGR